VSPARIYGGMTAEQREAGRRARLIDTAIELMGTRGAADTTVTAVCATSGVTSRYFYQHFTDRDALLRAVAEQLRATMQGAILAAIPAGSLPPDALAQAPIRAMLTMINDDPRLARILFVESGTEPTLRRLRSELLASFADLVWQQARLHLNISDSKVQVGELAAILGVGGVFEVLRRWADGELDYTADQLVEHCAGLLGSLAAYVLTEGAAE
jgi:AcrR family transcriptional regulator